MTENAEKPSLWLEHAPQRTHNLALPRATEALGRAAARRFSMSRSLMLRRAIPFALLLVGGTYALPTLAGCGSSTKGGRPTDTLGSGSDTGGDDSAGAFDVGGGLDDVTVNPETGTIVGDPTTCAQAASAHTYVGCDYWPTPVANNVWSIFDFAVVVANAGATDGSVTVTGPGGFSKTATVPAGGLTKVYLPWNPTLKGPDFDSCTSATPLGGSIQSKAGAYHLVSTVPVTVYQFNALEYASVKADGTPTGPAGKNWAACPGSTICASSGAAVGCNSYSNDASLLLPSTAMTGNYRVMGPRGWTETDPSTGTPTAVLGAYFAITATQNGTTVKIQLGSQGDTLAGGTVPALAGGGTMTLSMDAGDVIEVVGPAGNSHDFSGTIINASAPVQVITGVPCENVPEGTAACDHLESTVFPAETLGKDYYVPVTVGPKNDTPGHVVRIYGNEDGTTLTYDGTTPPGAPSTLSAGQVVDLGVVKSNFHVKGDKSFGVGTLMLGGSLVDPPDPFDPTKGGEGDPSQSFYASTEQFRKKYVFLAPDDYDISYAEIVAPTGASVKIDGSVASGKVASLGTGYGVIYVKLGPGKDGAHVLESDKPVGLQVVGYGKYTSYQYPAGLNLNVIAKPPTVK